jgi:purine-binding chemotaxis protein CheW
MLILRFASLRLGVFEDEIATVAEWRKPTPLPRAPAAILGVVSIQGRMLTVMDPWVLLGETKSIDGYSPTHIVALHGDEQLALAIECAEETMEVSKDDIQPPAQKTTGVFGVVHQGDQEIYVLNVKELFPAAIKGRERRRRRF